MASYAVGDVAGSLKIENGKACNKFVSLFKSAKKAVSFSLPTETGSQTNNSRNIEEKKRKLSESVSEETDDNVVKRRKPRNRRKLKADTEENLRTIFVGNVPISTTKENIKELFQDYGKIESVRFRSVPVADPTTSKKVACITRTFNPNRNNMTAFVKFEKMEDAEKATNLNGCELNGFYIRVDLASNQLKNDNKRSIFIGNLPFGIEENTLHKHFQDCGSIENVRIIRDSRTGIGKGFGYVAFKSEDSVTLALHLNGERLEGRQLRISRSVKKQKIVERPTTKKSNVQYQGNFENKNFKNKKQKRERSSITQSKSSNDFQGEKYSNPSIKKFKKKKKKRTIL